MYGNLNIYYFTGTGNALAAANWIAGEAENRGVTASVIQIAPSLKAFDFSVGPDTLVGFCYPTHGFNAPPVVIDFLLKFPNGNNPVFLLNTRAGMKLSKLFTPGLSGLAQLFPAIILLLKGYKIKGLQPMDLPSNWISIHPGLRQKVVDSIFYRCEKITKRFAAKILDGKNVFKGLVSLPIDLLISPISVAYILLGRFALAKTFIADSHCNNCLLCEKECPVKAIVIKNERPFWTHKCESCMHCMNRCPQRAIQTPHLFVAIIWWLVFLVLPFFILKELFQITPESAQYYNLIFDIVTIVTGFPVIFFSYRILHFLLKFRFFSALISYTSLIRLKFWRRYFAPKMYLRKN
ncbi:MAG TPA: hypothetical protein DER09_08820 [Prolixibacteraceae bacterium]|nr:hypothetical protein [Prolixibacteraceae bacterium]